MSIPYFTAEEVFHPKLGLQRVVRNMLETSQTRQQFSTFRSRSFVGGKSRMQPSFVQDFASYNRCWQSCWARSGYSSDAVTNCQILCGGPR